MNVRAVVFDLDDTLCGYWDACKAGLRLAYAEHPVPGVDTERFVRAWAEAFAGFGPTLKETHWYPTYLKNGGPTRIEQMRRALAILEAPNEDHAIALADAYAFHRNAELKLFPDAIECLTAISQKYPLGMITNGPADIQRQEVETLGIGHFFQHIWIEGEVGEGKPLKSVFDRALNAFGVEPSEIAMIGNSYSHDIRPAIEYGWHTIWTKRPTDVPPSAKDGAKPEERPAGAPEPSAVVGSLKEVMALLGCGGEA